MSVCYLIASKAVDRVRDYGVLFRKLIICGIPSYGVGVAVNMPEYSGPMYSLTLSLLAMFRQSGIPSSSFYLQYVDDLSK